MQLLVVGLGQLGLNFDFEIISSSTSNLEYQAGGGKGLVDLVNQLTLERCHSFNNRTYGLFHVFFHQNTPDTYLGIYRNIKWDIVSYNIKFG